MTTQPLARWSGQELAHFEQQLGVGDTWVAGRLGVRRDTVARWKMGRDPIPYRVPSELAAACRQLAAAASHLADTIA